MTEEEIKELVNSAIVTERNRIKDKIVSLPVYGTSVCSCDNRACMSCSNMFISHEDMKMFLESLIDAF
jgi:hypothetical protein